MSSNIHQLTHFPAFTWSQEAINDSLIIIKNKQVELLSRMNLMSDELKQEANLLVLKSDINANVKFEKHPVLDQINAILVQKTAVFDQNLSFLTNSTQNYNAPLTKDRLINWVSPINQEKPQFQNILLDQFLAWFNKPGLDRILKAAIAHLWFTSLSPFQKGNSLLARLITDMQLAKADGTHYRYYSLNAQLLEEQKEYEFILEQVQKGSLDITIWLQWFLNCLGRAYNASDNLLSNIIKKDAFWKKQEQVVFNTRQKQITNILLEGFNEKLTTSTYALITKCSRDTALRDVTDLMQKNILLKKEGFGKNTNYHLNS
jgi:Fic family protein